MERSARVRTGLGTLGRWAHEGALAGLLVALGIGALVTLLYQGLAISYRFPIDYSEGPLVDQAVRLAAGQNIYRPDLSAAPYTISNYPPLYVAALAPWVALLGPSFLQGRLLSALCAWVVAGCLALLIHTASRDRWAAAAGALSFVALPYVAHWSSLLRVDLLALALSLAALAVLVRWPGRPWNLPLAAVLLAASIYTRQSYALAAPAAGFVWLWAGRRQPRQALVLAGLVGGLSLAVFLALQLATDGGFFFNIVTANVNAYLWENLRRNLEGLGRNAWPLMALAASALLLGPRRNPLYVLAATYLLGGTLTALTIGKIGSNVNYLLELCAALGLAAGGLFAWARQAPRAWLAAGIGALLVAQAGFSVRATLNAYAGELAARLALTNDLYRLEAMIAEADGPVLADEYMGSLALAGRPLYLQPFEVTQLAWAGAWDQTPLLDSIEQQQFDLILLYDRPWVNERWTAEMLDAIEDHYRLAALVADNRVYRPYNRSAAVAAEACPGAPWRLPGEAGRGVQGRADGLMLFGSGRDGALPVVAVADGRLTRRRDWLDAVAIEHADPLRPGETVWTYYAGLAAANGRTSHVADQYPLGTEGAFVPAGEVIGYQGTWSGREFWPAWVHVRFAVVRGRAPGEFPPALTPEVMLDPAPYLGLAPALTAPEAAVQPLRCAGQ